MRRPCRRWPRRRRRSSCPGAGRSKASRPRSGAPGRRADGGVFHRPDPQPAHARGVRRGRDAVLYLVRRARAPLIAPADLARCTVARPQRSASATARTLFERGLDPGKRAHAAVESRPVVAYAGGEVVVGRGRRRRLQPAAQLSVWRLLTRHTVMKRQLEFRAFRRPASGPNFESQRAVDAYAFFGDIGRKTSRMASVTAPLNSSIIEVLQNPERR